MLCSPPRANQTALLSFRGSDNVVPADNKWFTRAVVAAAVIEAMADLDLTFPKVDGTKRKELAAARQKLM
jgi:hypothetical protein